MPRTVHLMNEFNVDWPLWGGLHGCDRSTPEEWDLSDELTARTLAWAAFFGAHYSWRDGWDHCENERAHRVEGQRLRRLLQTELGSEHEVELRLWECAPTPLIA